MRSYADADRARIERMMDDFGDEIAAMDPQGRCIREPVTAPSSHVQMLEDKSGPEGLVIVAEEHELIVGFASGRVETRSERERLAVIDFRNRIVPELCVSPEWRRRGVGRALLARLEELFQARECGAAVIEVFAPNRHARRFYDDLGYGGAGHLAPRLALTDR